MIRARILYLDEQGLRAYRQDAGQWQLESRFARTESSQEAFTTYLQQQKNSVFRLLVNLPGQETLNENIPVLHGKDRQALIERRLAQHFPSSELRTAISLGHPQENSAKEKLLLLALPQTGLFNPWLTQMEAYDTRLQGIFSITQLMPELLRRFLPLNGCQLFFLQHQGLLHQTLLLDGQIRFSRIIPNDTGSAATLLLEAAKLQQYLLNQHLVSRTENCPCIALAGPEITPQADPVTDCQWLQFPDQNTREVLFLDALNKQTPRIQFAPSHLRQSHRQARLRLFASGLSTLILLLCLGFGSQRMQQVSTLQTEIEQGQIKEKSLRTQLAKTGEAAETEVHSLNGLRQITRHGKAFLRQAATPSSMLHALSHILAQHPAIDLDTLTWSNEENLENLRITGEVLTDKAEFEQFVAALGVDRNRYLKVLQKPFAAESEQNLRGNTEEERPSAPGNFVITWEHKR